MRLIGLPEAIRYRWNLKSPPPAGIKRGKCYETTRISRKFVVALHDGDGDVLAEIPVRKLKRCT